ncbi:MAG: hypothetical protein ACXWSD_00655, partial [Bdellovibrionota bacterium]
QFFSICILSALSIWGTSPAKAAYELTTLLGTGNSRMPFVQEIVKNHVVIAPGDNFADYTTGVLYFAWRNGVNSAQTIQVLREGGNATLADIFKAIDLASQNSAIVLAPLSGDGVEEMCAKMAEKSATAFLITLGDVGYTLSPFFTKCASRNILFVTVLNADGSDLGEYASYGPLVRLAVPGMDLSAPVDGDRRVSFLSDGFGMAIAAGKLAALQRARPGLKGAELISEFLSTQDDLPILKGKVTGAKAILRFEK